MNALWKNQILDDYRVKKWDVDKIAHEYGYTADEISKVIFPKGRQKISGAIVDRKPLPDHPIKQGYKIIQGKKPKDPKWIEAGKKAHLKRLENLARKEAGLEPLAPIKPEKRKKEDPFKEMRKELGLEPKEEVPVSKPSPIPINEQTLSDPTVKAQLQIPSEINGQKLNRKQRRAILKQAKKSDNPHEVITSTIKSLLSGVKPIYEKQSSIQTRKKKKKEEIIKLLERVIKLLKEEDDEHPITKGGF